MSRLEPHARLAHVRDADARVAHVRDADKTSWERDIACGFGVLCTPPVAYKGIDIACKRNTLRPSKKISRIPFHDEDFHHEAACQLEDEELVHAWSYHLQPVLGSTRSEPSSIPVNC